MGEHVSDPIVEVVTKWHRYIRGELAGGLDELLDAEVVFYSPVVFTPQRGREITKLYLQAAGGTLGGDNNTDPGDGSASSFGAGSGAPGTFRYVKEVVQGHDALLEFETTMDGKYVNGIDLITCNDEGRIVEFKVMIRPLQAINAVHAAMKAMLESMA
jgi:hypothetical protein